VDESRRGNLRPGSSDKEGMNKSGRTNRNCRTGASELQHQAEITEFSEGDEGASSAADVLQFFSPRAWQFAGETFRKRMLVAIRGEEVP